MGGWLGRSVGQWMGSGQIIKNSINCYLGKRHVCSMSECVLLFQTDFTSTNRGNG